MKYKVLGKTNIRVSSFGFGSYRVTSDSRDHYKALRLALRSGVNLIDTSSNYMDGKSEELTGLLLESEPGVRREDLVIVTKAGYIQGRNLDIVNRRASEGNPYKGVVTCSESLLHCIHPEFLSDQLSLSLDRMKTAYADIFLLHNPEYYLSYTTGLDQNTLRKNFYAGIKEAFEHLETEVEKGRIKYYGVSSNTFVEKPSLRNFVSLEMLHTIAQEISADNHFAVVQMPMNLMEKNALVNYNLQKGEKSTLRFAASNNYGVLINRPLNAISHNAVTRLADFRASERNDYKHLASAYETFRKMEDNFRNFYIHEINVTAQQKETFLKNLNLTVIIRNSMSALTAPNQLTELYDYGIQPRLNLITEFAQSVAGDDASFGLKMNEYSRQLDRLITIMHNLLAAEANRRNSKIHSVLDNYLPSDVQGFTLSGKALYMLSSLPQISSVLVGMRKASYVEDVVSVSDLEPLPNPEEFWFMEK